MSSPVREAAIANVDLPKAVASDTFETESDPDSRAISLHGDEIRLGWRFKGRHVQGVKRRVITLFFCSNLHEVSHSRRSPVEWE